MGFGQRIMQRLGFVPAADLARVRDESAVQVGQLQRAFAAAQIGRLNNSWRGTTQSANRDISAALPLLRARSRELAQNNEYMRRFLLMVRNNVAGPAGVSLQVQALRPDGSIDQADSTRLEKAFAKWSRRGNCDITGRYSLRDIEHMAMTAVARDGESIIITHPGRGPFGFQIQLVDAALLDDRLNRDMANGRRIRMGIELDGDNRPCGYWFHQQNGTDLQGFASVVGSRHVRVPAENVYHLFVSEDADQLRGVPWAHASMAALNDLGGYKEAAIIAARIGASKMGFYVPASDDADPFPGTAGGTSAAQDDAGNFIDEVAPGEFGVVPHGYKIEKFDPTYPHNTFSDFYKSCLRGAATGFGVAYHSLASDLESVNMSSARVGMLEERDLWRAMQFWFIESFHDRLYSDWLTPALLSGQLDPLPFSKRDKFDAAIWQGRRWTWIDPLKDVQAAIAAIDAGLATRGQYIRDQALDPDDVWNELEKENARLTTILPQRNPPTKPAQKEDPEDA